MASVECLMIFANRRIRDRIVVDEPKIPNRIWKRLCDRGRCGRTFRRVSSPTVREGGSYGERPHRVSGKNGPARILDHYSNLTAPGCTAMNAARWTAVNTTDLARQTSWPSALAEDRDRNLMKGRPFVLNAEARALVESAIREVCDAREGKLLAINIRTNHAHIVAAAVRSGRRSYEFL